MECRIRTLAETSNKTNHPCRQVHPSARLRRMARPKCPNPLRKMHIVADATQIYHRERARHIRVERGVKQTILIFLIAARAPLSRTDFVFPRSRDRVILWAVHKVTSINHPES